jgi:hypothetical protein
VDLVIGVVTALVGLAFIATPWVCGLTANSLASTTIIAGRRDRDTAGPGTGAASAPAVAAGTPAALKR